MVTVPPYSEKLRVIAKLLDIASECIGTGANLKIMDTEENARFWWEIGHAVEKACFDQLRTLT
jgi:hypothetical protein